MARNQERKTGSKKKQQRKNSGESCIVQLHGSEKKTVSDDNKIRLSPPSYFLNGTMTDLILTCVICIPPTR